MLSNEQSEKSAKDIEYQSSKEGQQASQDGIREHGRIEQSGVVKPGLLWDLRGYRRWRWSLRGLW